jgi:hypothetical protein
MSEIVIVHLLTTNAPEAFAATESVRRTVKNPAICDVEVCLLYEE